MANIRIRKTDTKYEVTVDECPDIAFTEQSYKKARDRAVRLVKSRYATKPAKDEGEEKESRKVAMGFVA